MPPKKYPTTYKKRSQWPKRYKKRNQMVARVPRQPRFSKIKINGPVADEAYVQLKWSVNLTYNPAIGVTSQNTFRANSIFDPDFTGAGTQPRYFDQWAALYNSYQVMACSVRHDCSNLLAVPVYIATAFTDIDPTTLTLQSVCEQKFGMSHGVLGGVTGNGQKTITRYITMKQLHGLSNGTTQQDNLQALMTANPADPSFHKLCIQATDESTTASVAIRTTIIYYVRLFSLVNVAESS